MFHMKQCSWNTIRIRFGKAGAHPQLAWESQLPLKPCLSLQPFNFKGNCDSSDSLLDFCCVSLCSSDLLRKRGLLAHTSAAFLKNCCTEKLFGLCSVYQKIMPLGKTVFHIRQKGVPPLLLPASMLQLPRCLVRICNFFHRNNQIAD